MSNLICVSQSNIFPFIDFILETPIEDSIKWSGSFPAVNDTVFIFPFYGSKFKEQEEHSRLRFPGIAIQSTIANVRNMGSFLRILFSFKRRVLIAGVEKRNDRIVPILSETEYFHDDKAIVSQTKYDRQRLVYSFEVWAKLNSIGTTAEYNALPDHVLPYFLASVSSLKPERIKDVAETSDFNDCARYLTLFYEEDIFERLFV